MKFGRRVIRNYNRLIDHFPGADGMKTGFICASGFNLVATATRDGRRLEAAIARFIESLGELLLKTVL